jgi:hypothetical protein
MTAHSGDLGCFSEVSTETVLAAPGGDVKVRNVVLAAHGVYVAWAERDLSILPARAGEAATAVGTQRTVGSTTTATTTASSDATSSSSVADSDSLSSSSSPSVSTPTSPAYVSATATAAASSSFATAGPLSGKTTEYATTELPKPQMTNLAGGDMASAPQTLLSSTTTSTPPDPRTTNPSTSSTTQQAHPLPPSTIAGISIGAAAGLFILTSLIAIAVLARRRRLRLRSKAYDKVDVRVFESAAEWKDDKRRWSGFSDFGGEVGGCGADACDDGEGFVLEADACDDGKGVVSEADSRVVSGFVAELQGD